VAKAFEGRDDSDPTIRRMRHKVPLGGDDGRKSIRNERYWAISPATDGSFGLDSELKFARPEIHLPWCRRCASNAGRSQNFERSQPVRRRERPVEVKKVVAGQLDVSGGGVLPNVGKSSGAWDGGDPVAL
jgi:hypothetical protein